MGLTVALVVLFIAYIGSIIVFRIWIAQIFFVLFMLWGIIGGLLIIGIEILFPGNDRVQKKGYLAASVLFLIGFIMPYAIPIWGKGASSSTWNFMTVNMLFLISMFVLSLAVWGIMNYTEKEDDEGANSS